MSTTVPAVDRAVAGWRQVRPLRPVVTVRRAVAAWGVAMGPVIAQLHRLDHVPSSIVRLASITAVALALARRRPRLAPVVAVAAMGAAVLDPAIPRVTEAMAVVLVALWTLVVDALGRHAPRPAARAAAAVPLAGAATMLLFTTGVRGPAIATVVALVAMPVAEVAARIAARRGVEVPAMGAAAPWRSGARRVTGVVDGIGERAGAVLGVVTMIPAAVVVTVSWASSRAFGVDVLEPATASPTRWVTRGETDLEAHRAFAAADRGRPRAQRDQWRRAAAGACTVGVLLAPGASIAAASRDAAAPVGGGRSARSETLSDCLATDPDPTPNPVLADQPDSARLMCELRAFTSRARFSALTVYDYPDFGGRYVQQTDGRRRTWTPPDCGDCPRLRVWWFGGSAAWGWAQRPFHTIPSALARLAFDRGVALEITNYAMPAWVHSQESRRFEQLLTAGTPPDLAVFYDGGNELNRQKERNGRGLGADESPTSFLEAEIDEFLGTNWLRPDQAPGDRRLGPRLPPEEVAAHAIRRYAGDLDVTRSIAASRDVPVAFVWQPLMHSAPDATHKPNAVPAEDDPIWSRMVPAAVRLLPDGVVDLSDALDDVDEPVFDDFYHTNEYAATVVAAELLDQLWPQVVAAAGGAA